MNKLQEPLITELFEKRDVLATAVMVPGDMQMCAPPVGFLKFGDHQLMMFMGISNDAKFASTFISFIGVIKDNHDMKEDMMVLKGMFVRMAGSSSLPEISIWGANINPYFISHTLFKRTPKVIAKLRQFKYEECRAYGDQLLEEFRSITRLRHQTDVEVLGNF